MAHVSEQIENKYFLDALKLFHEAQWLYNTPVTEILMKGILDAFPSDWLNALKTLSNQELNDFVIKKMIKPEWSETLQKFVKQCRYIDRLPVKSTSFSMELPQNFRVGLSYKKQHEIWHLAHLVHMQCAPLDIKVVVDLGAGLGYVCQLLYHLYNYQVLGLEKNEMNVENARNRQKKMYPNSLTNVKYGCCDLTDNSVETVESILQKQFPGSRYVCLIGLHACGDLSIHATKIFQNMKAAHVLIMISCCYHKLSLSKNIKIDASDEKQYFNNFPLSHGMKSAIAATNFDIGSFLRQPFLRLACQEPADRWCNMSTEDHNKHSLHVLARALFQLYAAESGLSLKKRVQKGTRKSQCTNFQTYVKDALLRYRLEPEREQDSKHTSGECDLETHEKNILKLWDHHHEKLQTAEIYSGLQLMLQGPAESLVLQDRLSWMQEHGLEAIIIPVMNKTLSPRSYAIVSQKK